MKMAKTGFMSAVSSLSWNRNPGTPSLFGFVKTRTDSLYSVSNSLLEIKAPLDDNLASMYQTGDDYMIPISHDSSFIIQKGIILPTFYHLQFHAGRPTLYEFDRVHGRLRAVEQPDLTGSFLLKTQYQDHANNRATKRIRFETIQQHSLDYQFRLWRHLPSFLVEDPSLVALLYIHRPHTERVCHISPLVKAPLLLAMSYGVWRLTYFEETKHLRNAIVNLLDPRKRHIGRLPRSFVITTIMTLCLSGIISL